MAGQHTSGARVESSSVDEGSLVGHGMHSAVASGFSAGTARRRKQRATRPVATRQTVRLLTLRGLEPAEAANLTAYLCGIPVADRHWALREINQLLFLRELNRSGRFGALDGIRGGSASPA